VSWRNYDLSHSLARAMLNMLPGGGTVQRRLEHYQDTATDEDPLKVAHLVSLARCLLSNKHCSTSPLITKLLQDKDDEFEDFSEGPKISMKELRQHSLEAGVHDFFWTEMSDIPAHKFAVGDFGYVPSNTAFGDFVKLGNIYSDNLANLPITARTYGSQFCWEDRPVQHVEIQKYPLPLDVYGWPIAVPRGSQIDCQIEHSERIGDTNEAWGFLSNHAKQLAGKFNVAPEDLILIIAAGTNQNFDIREFGYFDHPIYRMPTMHAQQSYYPTSFMNHTSMSPYYPTSSISPYYPFSSMNHTSIPTIMYLLTSPRSDFEPFWSHQPMYVPNTPLPELNHGLVPSIGDCNGFIEWIRLLKEDFVD